jgi:lipopolysaccharide transport system permease protein
MATLSVGENSFALSGLSKIITRNWTLTWTMAKREITDRHVGQMLGMVWAIGHPLILILVYIFIFGFVFKAKVGAGQQLPMDYAIYLLSGLLPWMAINDCMNKSCGLLTGNANLVKQVVFPLEVLPIKGILATLFPQALCTALLVIYICFTTQSLPWTLVLLPLLIGMQILMMCGIGFLFGAISPFFRDLKDIVQVFSVIGVYLIPVVYQPNMVPNIVRPLLFFNPFSHLIWCFQDVFYFGGIDHPWSWALMGFMSVIGCVMSYRIFQRLKPFFGNVL